MEWKLWKDDEGNLHLSFEDIDLLLRHDGHFWLLKEDTMTEIADLHKFMGQALEKRRKNESE